MKGNPIRRQNHSPSRSHQPMRSGTLCSQQPTASGDQLAGAMTGFMGLSTHSISRPAHLDARNRRTQSRGSTSPLGKAPLLPASPTASPPTSSPSGAVGYDIVLNDPTLRDPTGTGRGVVDSVGQGAQLPAWSVPKQRIPWASGTSRQSPPDPAAAGSMKRSASQGSPVGSFGGGFSPGAAAFLSPSSVQQQQQQQPPSPSSPPSPPSPPYYPAGAAHASMLFTSPSAFIGSTTNPPAASSAVQWTNDGSQAWTRSRPALTDARSTPEWSGLQIGGQTALGYYDAGVGGGASNVSSGFAGVSEKFASMFDNTSPAERPCGGDDGLDSFSLRDEQRAGGGGGGLAGEGGAGPTPFLHPGTVLQGHSKPAPMVRYSVYQQSSLSLSGESLSAANADTGGSTGGSSSPPSPLSQHSSKPRSPVSQPPRSPGSGKQQQRLRTPATGTTWAGPAHTPAGLPLEEKQVDFNSSLSFDDRGSSGNSQGGSGPGSHSGSPAGSTGGGGRPSTSDMLITASFSMVGGSSGGSSGASTPPAYSSARRTASSPSNGGLRTGSPPLSHLSHLTSNSLGLGPGNGGGMGSSASHPSILLLQQQQQQQQQQHGPGAGFSSLATPETLLGRQPGMLYHQHRSIHSPSNFSMVVKGKHSGAGQSVGGQYSSKPGGSGGVSREGASRVSPRRYPVRGSLNSAGSVGGRLPSAGVAGPAGSNGAAPSISVSVSVTGNAVPQQVAKQPFTPEPRAHSGASGVGAWGSGGETNHFPSPSPDTDIDLAPP